MKKFTLIAIAVFFSVVAFAQKQKPVMKAFGHMELRQPQLQMQLMNDIKQMSSALKQPKAKAPAKRRVVTSATELAGSYVWDYTTASDLAEDPTTVESTAESTRVTITATSDNELTISGIASNDLTGSYNAADGYITIAKGQIAGTSQYGDYVLNGLFYYEGDETNQAGWYFSDIYIIPGEDGTLTIQDWLALVLSGGEYDGYSLTPYWLPGSTLTPAEPLTPVEAPEGAEFKEYAMSGTDYSGNAYNGTAYIAIVENDVYLKGFSSFLPDALVKGLKDGNAITFPADQYLGSLSGYDFYFLPSQYGGKDAVFTYDADNDTYTCTGEVFSLYDKYIDIYTSNPVLKGVVEKAAMPANPSITSLESSSWGQIIMFNVPNVDTNGDGLVAAKLSYQFFVDVEKEVSALTFTPATHSKLTADMTIIPFGFTDNYDFSSGEIYLNDLYSADWNKIGIKSIYTGGGETNETEIQWYTIKNYAIDDLKAEITAAETLAADEAYKTGQSALQAAIDVAKAVTENAEATSEDIKAATEALKAAEAEFKALNTAYNKLAAEVETATALKDTEDMVYGKSALNEAINKANRSMKSEEATAETLTEALTTLQEAEQAFRDANGFSSAMWEASKQGYGNAEVVESAQINDDLSLTLAQGEASYAPAYYNSGSALRVYYKNSFTIAASENVKSMTKIVITQSGSSYGTELTASVGELTKSGSTLTWVGDATEVTFTNFKEGGTNTQTRIRTITVTYQGQPDQLVTLPETAEVQAWTLNGQTVGSSTSAYDYPTEVAFDGESDIYVKGLFPYVKDSWVKGTIANGKATFAAGQLLVDAPSDGEKYYILGSADGETICDFTLAYDTEAKTLTQETEYIYINYLLKNKINPNYLESWQNLKLTFGIEEPVTPPADLVAETWNLNTTIFYAENETEPYEAEVQVGFAGDDVFVQGLAPNAPQLWIKGTKNADGKYVVPALQFMGETIGWFKMKYYFSALDAEDNFVDAVFTFDEAKKTLTTDQKLVLNRGKQELSSITTFSGTTTIANLIGTGIANVNEVNGSASYFDVQGRPVEKSHKGLVIMQARDSNGNVKTMKVMR